MANMQFIHFKIPLSIAYAHLFIVNKQLLIVDIKLLVDIEQLFAVIVYGHKQLFIVTYNYIMQLCNGLWSTHNCLWLKTLVYDNVILY